jgi:hypothetical protein
MIEPFMVMHAVTAFEMTVQINSKLHAGNNLITIFCKMIVQTLVILLDVFNKDTSGRIFFAYLHCKALELNRLNKCCHSLCNIGCWESIDR